MEVPFSDTMTSLACKPAVAAGLAGSTDATNAPVEGVSEYYCCSAGVTVSTVTPM